MKNFQETSLRETKFLQNWFEDINSSAAQLSLIFENIPGVSFFIKDINHRLIFVNKSLLNRFGLDDEEQLKGKTDFDLFPPRLAEHFRREDRIVFETKKPRLNILELFFNKQGLPGWCLTNKYPIFDSSGDVVGIMGTVRPHDDGELKWEREDGIGRAVGLIRQKFRKDLAISDLVNESGLNHRKLHRGFIELFGIAPMQFITRTRIEAACDDLLTTSKKLAVIAKENGFYDQSSFTQHFRRQMKVTPLKYRKQKGFA
ncbi:MAG: AraC family transcriptional regulator [Opitutae bacterium]|jgi:PAS domain S-box-containing protein|nr:AraC family transcriptional regulator [Opitutae bacterium]